VSQKVNELEAIDLRVEELQASLDNIAVQAVDTSAGQTPENVSAIDDAIAIADAIAAVTDTTSSSSADAIAKIESVSANGAVKVDDIEALAAVLLDQDAIESARENGNLAELVEQAKKRALDEAIDRGIVNQTPMLMVLVLTWKHRKL